MRLRHILSAANRSRELLSRRSARGLSTFPRQHHSVPYGQADRVKALLTRSSDEIERFQRESFPFPRKHDSVPYGQADILNARVGLDETVKGDDGVIISILGLYHFPAPQNIVAHDQPAGFE